MSLRIDTTEWIPGCLLIGETGLGVLAQNIPSTGTDGPGYTYGDLSLPADNGKEICGRITSWPSAGTFYAYEDTSFVFTAPDGSYTALNQLYVDGVAIGSPATITLNIGSGSNTQVNPGVGSMTFTGYAPSISQSNVLVITPGVGNVAFTGYAPTVAFTGLRVGNPGVGLLTFQGYAPHVLNQSYDSDVGSIGNISMFATGPLWG